MDRFRWSIAALALIGLSSSILGCGRVGYELVDWDPDAGLSGGSSGTAGAQGGAGFDAAAGGMPGTGGVVDGGAGGTATGGALDGGTATGGIATGGMGTGGAGTGGTGTGGAGTGGAGTGRAGTGGVGTGGAGTGGAGTGGVGTGGAGTGGVGTGGTGGGDAAPARPTGLAANTDVPGTVELRWNANSESDISHYILYRSTMSGFLINQGGVVIVGANIQTTMFVDGNRPACTTYYYRLVAVDRAGNPSTPTATVKATTLGAELVVNGSFEQGGSGWPTGWVDPMTPGGRTTTVAFAGNASLHVKGIAFAGTTRPSAEVTLVPQRRYRLSGRARVPADVEGFGLQGGYYHMVNNFPVALAFSSFLRTGSRDWSAFSQDFTVPTGYMSGFVQLYFGLVKSDEEGFFDAISLREICGGGAG